VRARRLPLAGEQVEVGLQSGEQIVVRGRSLLFSSSCLKRKKGDN
jgi:hypothetical protein